MTSAAETTLYGEGLDRDRKQIRLLTVLQTFDPSEVVRGQLETVSLLEEPEYVALSYVWGDYDAECVDRVVINGQVRDVTRNLASALWHFRGNHMNRGNGKQLRIWVDALCINQRDLDERRHQVGMMGDVYSQATFVYSWVAGPKDISTPHAIAIINEIMTKMDAEEGETMYHQNQALGVDLSPQMVAKFTRVVSETPKLCEQWNNTPIHQLNPTWSAIFALNRLEYWSRIWVYQEMILSSDRIDCHVFICGYSTVTATALYAFCRLTTAMLRHSEVTDLKPAAIAPEVWATLKQNDILLAIQIQKLRKIMISHRHSGTGGMSSSQIFLLHMDCKASDPRDMMYATLGILPLDIRVDYTLSVRQVYLDWYSAVFSKTDPASRNEPSDKFLSSTLANAGALTRETNPHRLPYWLPDFNNASSEDQFSVDFLPKRTCYFDDARHQCFENGVLKIRGALCDTITQCLTLDDSAPLEYFKGPAMHDLKSQFSPALWPTHAFELIFLSTMIWGGLQFAGQLSAYMSTGLPLEELLLLVKSMAAHSSDEDIIAALSSDSRLLGADSNQSKSLEMIGPIMYQLRMELRIKTKGCCLFKTAMGYGGITRVGARIGDTLCLMNGCGSPILLRREIDDWVHLASCYVDNISNEPLLEIIQRHNLEVKWFDIQ
ncbi:hypothetical protein PFICI_11317 [Pestalotiopsis fici W106-1]|uniref:Heterokaryon incompatibility domain-containing protein n=1 Tax=Pestalotiopsis fici (strain W106-1 / CGMCC3.15140) TaxID=1229662 RepID=W3WU82_PESFW|nr:uncharacterized protein PFICI_11317 [Pestalotiopsis fici W106-1]ETS77443.1 hypothetical protein PFICI_11317 [Pestalotiopsis fici W106-1]